MQSSTDDDIRADFLAEANELLERVSAQLLELERKPDDPDLLNAIFRAFHTVKGGAGFLNLPVMVALCHATEDVFNALRARRRAVDADLLDVVLQATDQVQAMLAAVGAGHEPAPAPAALLAALARLLQPAEPAAAPVVAATVATIEPGSDAAITEDEFEALLDQLHGKGAAPGAVAPPAVSAPLQPAMPASPAPRPAETESLIRVDTARLDRLMNLVGELVLVRNRLKLLCPPAEGGETARSLGELDYITRGLQQAVMQVRMQPIGKVFARFPKLARELARNLGKQVELTMEGQDTDLDKNLVDALADPLVHMLRNSIDHGIEMPEVRMRAGKPATGTVRLCAQQAGDHIVVTVADDGAGMDPTRIRDKAVEKGLIDRDAAARLSATECLQLVCLPGFSTKEAVSDLSGRGVGMDVVGSCIHALNGSLQIESTPGQGSCIRIRVPLTLAILSALIVRCGAQRYALPLAAVSDVFGLDAAALRKLDRWDVVPWRGAPLRLVPLDPWLAPLSPAARHVVVAGVRDEAFGFVVGEVRGREEIVVKPLGESLRGLAGIGGATVMPDGGVALILDFDGLATAWKRSLETAHG